MDILYTILHWISAMSTTLDSCDPGLPPKDTVMLLPNFGFILRTFL